MTKSIFITGTDTDVGKTIITGLLLDYALSNKKSATTQKWIQCGNDETPDTLTHQKLSRFNQDNNHTTYTLKEPVSPHLAAEQSNTIISEKPIVSAYLALSQSYEWVFVEGTGGIAVPYTRSNCLSQIVATLNLPTVLVVSNRVGCINHATLTSHYMKSKNIHCLGFIMNNSNEHTESLATNDHPIIIESVTELPFLGTLSYNLDPKALRQEFKEIGRKVFDQYEHHMD